MKREMSSHSLCRSRLPGRGAAANPPNRFERVHLDPDLEQLEEEGSGEEPPTEFFRDPSRSILARNDSPDVGFDVSLNPYRGCEHGCVYCYARPTHEYLGFSAGLDFETKILVKEEAPALLRRALMSPRWVPQPIALSGATDCYQPVERRLKLTRRCLEVLAEFRNPAIIITKNRLVTRDADVLAEMAAWDGVSVTMSVTSLKQDLQRRLEPRASSPRARLESIETLAGARIPVGVLVAPVIPALTDEEIPSIIRAVADAGATNVRFIALRLPHGVKDLFESWLSCHFPNRRAKVMNRVRAMRDGALNDPRFGTRMRGEGLFADQIEALFETACRRAGLTRELPPLSVASFRRPGSEQLSLFGGRA